ncbi:MAG: DUF4139 domain-containing protein [Minicystis sp.]
METRSETAEALAQPAAAGELSLRRIVLSSGGLGYFEHEATVSGDAALPLDVRLDQVDDVLKSLIVYADRGNVGEIVLPGKAPASTIFRDVPFDRKALDSEPALLGALRGAEVRVQTKDGVGVAGQVVSVTPEQAVLPNMGGTITRHRLVILANGVVTTVILEDVASLSFVDPALSQQLGATLAALLSQKERGRRQLSVHTTGEGQRVVRVAYVVEAPIWKATYRLLLPADSRAKTAALQGFAIVENQSGKDWKDVDLTVVSGNPAAFHQALYESYYARRPEVPVEVVGRVLPRIDTGTVTSKPKTETRGGLACAACAACSPSVRPDSWAPESAPLAPAPLVVPMSTEAATQVVFHFGAPVTLENGRNAMLPIVDAAFPAERISLYQPETNAHNPLASVRITNDRATGLPPGAVTIYERSPENGALAYAGDARLATLPPGESRILSFAVDQKVRIDARDQDPQLMTLATIAGGVLTLHRTERRTTVYTIAGAALEPRTVLLEVPRLEGFDLAAPKDGVERTPTHYRIRVEVAAGATVTVPVTLERPLVETHAVANLSRSEIRAYASASDLPEATRAALARVADAMTTVDEKEALVKSLEDEHGRIVAEQVRIRENLKVVPAGSPLSARYLAELTTQEDRLAALETQLAAARSEVDRARRVLVEIIRGLHAG